MPYALCPMPYALCPTVPHLSLERLCISLFLQFSDKLLFHIRNIFFNQPFYWFHIDLFLIYLTTALPAIMKHSFTRIPFLS